MFPPEIQLIFNAQTALQAAEQKDPRFEELVTRMIERLSLTREQVIRGIVALAQGQRL